MVFVVVNSVVYVSLKSYLFFLVDRVNISLRKSWLGWLGAIFSGSPSENTKYYRDK